jgi:nitronate monooxygenase
MIIFMTGGNFLHDLGIQYPIIQGPMSGGATTPALVAAVCNAGALGSLGASYLTPDQIVSAIKAIRELTSKPFNVNLFAGGYAPESPVDAAPMLAILAEIHAALELPAPLLPAWPANPFDEQLEVVLQARPAVFSFTFGIPDPDALARIRERGIAILGTATTAKEGRRLDESGVTAIVAQGAEAGGHRGTFVGPFETSMLPTLELVRSLRNEVSVPVIASGGLMDGRDIAASLASGAVAAQLGTAFLTCAESGVSESYKRAILAARADTTLITRAFSGRPARALPNTFTAQLKQRPEIILPFPLQNTLTRPMRKAAAKLGNTEFQSLFAGQGASRTRSLSAAALVRALVSELDQPRTVPT